MKAALDKLEKSLVEPLDTKAPVKMPPNARKGLAKALWIIALVFGILQLLAAWGLWRAGHYVNNAIDYYNSLSGVYGMNAPVDNLGAFFYLSLLVLVVDAVILLAAVSGLKAMRKAGWNLLFYSLLLNLVYGVVRLFSETSGGFGYLLMALLSSAIGAYLLFQVRDQFKSA